MSARNYSSVLIIWVRVLMEWVNIKSLKKGPSRIYLLRKLLLGFFYNVHRLLPETSKEKK